MNTPLDQTLECEAHEIEVRNELSNWLLVAGAAVLLILTLCKDCP